MSNIPRDIEEIDKRIALLKNNKEYKHTKASNFSNGLQIVVELTSGVIVGIGIGYVLDKLFDFRFLFLVIFTVLGGIAGLLNVVRYLKNKDTQEGEIQ